MQEIKRLESTTEEFINAQTKQINRLRISSWFYDSFELNGLCPICHNTLESEQSTLNSLVESLKDIENNGNFRKEVPITLDLEKSRIISEIEKHAESLEGIRIQKRNLIESSESIKNEQYKIEKIQRFIGNIENALILYKQLGVNEKLNSEVNELKRQVEELQQIVDRRLIRKKTDTALDNVSKIASEILPMLDVEFPDSPIKLNDIDLTVQVIRDGGYDNLWQIGSGSNWLAYHIAVMLSLQIFFKKMINSPVPGLLIFDQPSQVYFPSNISKDDDDPKLTNEDMLAVKKVFMTMKSAIEKSSNNLQILIFDHASEEVWNGIEGIHLVEEWRNGLKLIPEEWLQV